MNKRCIALCFLITLFACDVTETGNPPLDVEVTIDPLKGGNFLIGDAALYIPEHSLLSDSPVNVTFRRREEPKPEGYALFSSIYSAEPALEFTSGKPATLVVPFSGDSNEAEFWIQQADGVWFRALSANQFEQQLSSELDYFASAFIGKSSDATANQQDTSAGSSADAGITDPSLSALCGHAGDTTATHIEYNGHNVLVEEEAYELLQPAGSDFGCFDAGATGMAIHFTPSIVRTPTAHFELCDGVTLSQSERANLLAADPFSLGELDTPHFYEGDDIFYALPAEELASFYATGSRYELVGIIQSSNGPLGTVRVDDWKVSSSIMHNCSADAPI